MGLSSCLKNLSAVTVGFHVLLAAGCGGSSTMNESTDNVKHISPMDFATEVTSSRLPVVVAFYTVWSGPCAQFVPVLDRVAGEFKGQIKVVKLNVDESPGLAQNYQVQDVPAVIFFKDTKLVDRLSSQATEADLKSKMEKLAGK